MPDIRKAVPCRRPMVSKMKMSGASYSSLISGIVLGYSCHPMISTSFMQIENQRKIACHGKTSKCWWRLVVWCGNVEAASMCPPYFNTFLWHWLNSLLSATWAHYHQDIKTHLLAEAPDLAFWQGTFPPRIFTDLCTYMSVPHYLVFQNTDTYCSGRWRRRRRRWQGRHRCTRWWIHVRSTATKRWMTYPALRKSQTFKNKLAIDSHIWSSHAQQDPLEQLGLGSSKFSITLLSHRRRRNETPL